jgi:von Willebrand factor type A domain
LSLEGFSLVCNGDASRLRLQGLSISFFYRVFSIGSFLSGLFYRVFSIGSFRQRTTSLNFFQFRFGETTLKNINPLVWPTLVLIFSLVSCPNNPTTPTGPVPVKATFNGVRKINAVTGTAQISVSALDKDSLLLPSGTITEPVVTGSSTTTLALNARATFQATSNVCGAIASSGGSLRAILTFDGSGSMSDTDPGQLRNQAAKSFVDRMGSTDQAIVGSFSTLVTLPPIADLTSDKAKLKAAIDKATYASGGTNLWGAAFESTNLIATASGPSKIAIVFTDGEDTSNRYTPTEVIANANAKGIKMYMVGFGDSINATKMTAVANGTNGIYRGVRAASDLKDLFNTTFNAVTAAGCIEIVFSPIPNAGTTVNGSVQFKVNGAALNTPFTINF